MEIVILLVAALAAVFVWKKVSSFYISSGQKKVLAHFGGGAMAFFVFVAIITITTLSNDEEQKSIITKQELGDKWPFTYDSAELECFVDNGIKSPLVTVNGKRYGLTGFADNMYGAGNIDAINAVWLENKDYQGQGLYVDLGPVTNRALALCE